MRGSLWVVATLWLVACASDSEEPAGGADAGADDVPVVSDSGAVDTALSDVSGSADATVSPDSGPGGDAAGVDVAPVPDTTLVPDLPALSLDCSECHDLGALTVAAGDEAAGPREWMTLAGVGLVRLSPVIPVPGVKLTLPWARRGRHDSTELGTCGACHPIREDGVGHGIRAYPSAAAVFSSGVSCASSCHEWLGTAVVASGFEGSDGATRTYEGSMRPVDLLQSADNAHSAIWREGARADGDHFRINAFNPGCGGCHNLSDESHGAVLGCLDCHDFGGENGELHTTHVAVIADHAESNDVEAVANGMSFCTYCHTPDDTPAPRSSAACYNCHLSGHQPLDASAQAHFWPVGP